MYSTLEDEAQNEDNDGGNEKEEDQRSKVGDEEPEDP